MSWLSSLLQGGAGAAIGDAVLPGSGALMGGLSGLLGDGDGGGYLVGSFAFRVGDHLADGETVLPWVTVGGVVA